MIDTQYILDRLADQYAGRDTFDVVGQGHTTGVVWAARRDYGVTLICLRGSFTTEDWARDAAAVANPFTHEVFGPVHAGFHAGLPDTWNLIKANTTGPYIVAGHSLGAARAAILSAIMKADGQPPVKRVEFAEPKPGWQKLRLYLSGVPSEIYRTVSPSGEQDHVTEVPIGPFVASGTVTDLRAVPMGVGPFCLHHLGLYAEGFRKSVRSKEN